MKTTKKNKYLKVRLAKFLITIFTINDNKK